MQGLSLVEWSVAQALGLLVLLALLAAWNGGRAAHRQQASLSAVQEAGRVALALIARDVRMAGHAGCGRAPFLDHLSAASSPAVPAPFDDAVALPAVERPAGASDVLTVVGGGGDVTRLAVPMPDDRTLVLAAASRLGRIEPGDLLLLSDCVHTEVVRVGSVSGDTVVLAATTGHRFGAGAWVMRYAHIQYRVQDGELRRNGVAVVAGVTGLRVEQGWAQEDAGAAGRTPSEQAAATTEVGVLRVRLDLRHGEVARPFETTIMVRNGRG
jgi:type IV pilus assembly protein PilW